LFAVVFIVFDIIEKMVIGVLRGKAVADSIETFGGGGILVAIIVAIALVPFFGFVELSRLLDQANSRGYSLPTDHERPSLVSAGDPISGYRPSRM
jgi:hypothetical protein